MRAPRYILLINGHPDPRPERLCAALAAAYAQAARSAGHQVRRIDVGALDVPLIGSVDDFIATPSPAIADIQRALRKADHIVIIHPLWLGATPARLKAFLEQVFRYGVALNPPGSPGGGLLKGKSARIVITMGMPAFVFRWAFGAHGLKGLERGLLWLCGVGPIRHLILGGVETCSPQRRRDWLRRMEVLGARAG